MGIIDTAIDKGIIEPEELHELLNSETSNVKILDGSFALPNATENPYQNYLQHHIEGALFFDIKDAADKSSDLPHMLPSPEAFESYMSNLGISNDDFVVIYGQSGMVMGPARVWWALRAFGHERVCLLNGGLPAWENEELPLSDAATTPEKSEYKAQFRPELVRNMDDVQSALNTNTQILDARPAARFSGKAAEPRANMRSGHIPGSKNLPCINLIDHDSGKLKPAADLESIFRETGFDSSQPIITTCGSGVTACVIVLALFQIGEKNVPVYDGSWSEWGQDTLSTDIEKSYAPWHESKDSIKT